ncbi:MAG: hypothetical protein WD076_11850 [Parvularculaceae bacterium]
MRRVFQIFLLPGFVFQSVLIGGGYGTGREIAEFFMRHGAIGGLLGLVVTTLIWSVLLAIAFDFARLTRTYDYRGFFRALLGPFWRLFEIVYLLLALIILAVLGSASGEILAQSLSLPRIAGAIVLLGTVGILAFYGGGVLARAMALWTFILVAAYATLFVWTLSRFGGEIGSALQDGAIIGAWHVDAVRYAAYNFVAFVAVLFALRPITSRVEAITAGAIAGVFGIAPAALIFIAMLALYPEIAAAPVPVSILLQSLDRAWFMLVFQIVLLGTFIETGAGIIHSVNERIAGALEEKGMRFPHWARLATAIVFLGVAVFLAEGVGIIDLIAKGYGFLSYAFIAVVIVPLLTIGVYRVLKSG